MAGVDQRVATLREFGSYLSTLMTCLKVLWSEATDVKAKQDNSALRRRHFASCRLAVVRAKELLNDELRQVIPEESVESVKSWCIDAERTFDRTDQAVRLLAGACPRMLNPHPSAFTSEEREFGPEWEVGSGRTLSHDNNRQPTANLLSELNTLSGDVENFKRAALKTVKQTTNTADSCGTAVTQEEALHIQTRPTVANESRATPFYPPDLQILIAMSDLMADDQDSRKSARKIAEEMSPPKTRDDIKDGLNRLRERGYIQSIQQGNAGGYWLTAKGRKKLPKAKAKRKPQ